MTRPVLRTALCDKLDIEYPILLAGMGSNGRATPPALVAAVSNAGGMGVLGGAGLPPEVLQEAIRETRQLTDKPIGVDLLLPASVAPGAAQRRSDVRAQLVKKYPDHVKFLNDLLADQGVPASPVKNEFVVANTSGGDGGTPGSNQKNMIQQQVDVIMDEDVQVFAAGLGDPSWVVPRAHARGMTVMGLAGSPRNAQRQKDAGVDIVVAQGYEAGGHTGKIANFPLLPQVVDAVAPNLVLAAGGIVDGRGVAAALSLGASGVWVGTAFLVSEESNIDDVQKQQIIDGRSQDFDISRTYSGKTMRGYRNTAIKAFEESGLPYLPMPYQKILMDDLNSAAVAAHRMDLHSNPAGQGSGFLTKKRPAADIMADLVSGAVETLGNLPERVTFEPGV